MAVTFRSTTTAKSSGNTGSQAVTKPAGATTGDLLIVIAWKSQGTSAFNALSGFTNRLDIQAGSSANRMGIWTRTCDGTEGASFTPSAVSGISQWIVVAMAYSGAAALSFDAVATTDHSSSSSTTWTSGGVTTAAANEMVLYIVGTEGFATPATGATPPTGFTERMDTSTSGDSASTWKAIYVAEKLFSGAGATGSINIGTGYSEQTFQAAMAIAEASAGPTFVPQIAIVMA